MLERIPRLAGETLGKDDYVKQFRASWERLEDVFWKLERGQTFREPGSPSWEAWMAGDWDGALAAHEQRRASLEDYYRQAHARGVQARRIRIVEHPVCPYLQWELHALRVRAEAGERIRVLDAARLGDLEAGGVLPEVTVLGTRVLFELRYDANGTPRAARKITDPEAIRACRTELAELYEQGEDLQRFFEREVAHLPPPVPEPV